MIGNRKHILSFQILSAITLALVLLFLTSCEPSNGNHITPEKNEANPTRFVAITFDDAPLQWYYSYPDSFLRWQTLQSFADTLNFYGVPTTIFAIGKEVETLPDGKEMLDFWMEHGVDAGNHSYTHRSFNELSVADATAEIEQTSEILLPFVKKYQQHITFFRFPFLQEGNTLEKEKAFNTLIKQKNLVNAKVSIGIDDWSFNDQYRALELAQNWEERYEVGQRYLAEVKRNIAFWDSVGTTLAHRPIKHVFMVHINRINRDYLGAILREFKSKGFGFISLEEAYQDPIYNEPDEWATPAGVSFLEHIKQTRMLGNEE